MQGNLLWLGRASECATAALPNGSVFYVVDFSLQVTSQRGLPGTPSVGGPLQGKEALCLPASCSTRDAGLLAGEVIDQVVGLLNSSHVSAVHIQYEGVMEVSRDKGFFTSVYSVSRFCTLVMFVMVVILATVLDLMGYQNPPEHKQGREQDPLKDPLHGPTAEKDEVYEIIEDPTETEPEIINSGHQEMEEIGALRHEDSQEVSGGLKVICI